MTKTNAIAIACASIWLGVASIALLAPDLVSGSQHEHLPLAAITVWIWGVASTGYPLLMLVTARDEDGHALKGLAISIVSTWLLASAISILGPELVTGSDPTRIPIAALIAPPAATIATAFACLFASITMAQAVRPAPRITATTPAPVRH